MIKYKYENNPIKSFTVVDSAGSRDGVTVSRKGSVYTISANALQSVKPTEYSLTREGIIELIEGLYKIIE